ncbi:hypothetical protein ACOSP7_013158 [Xanthoceras sorbifolium]
MAELADDRVCNAMVKARHDLMIQYKVGRVDKWKVDEWIVDYKELVGEVDIKETAPVKSQPRDKQVMEVDSTNEVERANAPPADPLVILDLTALNSTQSQAGKDDKEEEKKEGEKGK